MVATSSFQVYKQRFEALPQKTKLTLVGSIVGVKLLLLFLLISSFLGNSKTFRKASSVVGSKSLKAIVSENYSGRDPKSIYDSAKAMNVDGKLSIIDFNNRALCGNVAGTNGCLYVGYTAKGNKVFSFYLDPTVVKDRPLFQVSDQQKDGLPCLKISQANYSEPTVPDAVQVYDYCYSAGTQSYIRLVNGLEKPVLLQPEAPTNTPAASKKKGSESFPSGTPSPTPVLSPS